MLTGPSVIVQSPQKAFILCHGYGANGEDLASLADFLQLKASTALFCPNAPTSLEFGGYEWFSLNDFRPKETVSRTYAETLTKRALPAAHLLLNYINQIKQTYALRDENILLGGFSQGGLVAALAALTASEQPAGLIGMSAVPICFSDLFSLKQVKHHLPVLLTHGSNDPVVPLDAMRLNESELKQAGQTIQTVISEGLGHGIDSVCLNAIHHFLKQLDFAK